jgi:ketosteroid isomerase-like protein
MQRFLIFVAAMLALVPAAWSQNTAEKAVTDLEQQWLKAQQTNTYSDALFATLADGYTYTSPDGKLFNRADAIADAKATKFTSVDDLDLKVAVYGDTAIVTGISRSKGTDAGKPFGGDFRFTDTWVKINGKWQCVASHNSAVSKM